MDYSTNNPIYAELKRSTLIFSKGAVEALNHAPFVQLHANPTDKLFLLEPSIKGVDFAKAQIDTVTWNKRDILDYFRRILPEGRKQGITIYGEVVNSEDEPGSPFGDVNMLIFDLGNVTKPTGIWAKTFVEVEDKKGFLSRYKERLEELGAYSGTYPMADIDDLNRFNAILHGEKRPRWTELDAIAESLKVSVEWLLFGEGEIWHPKW